MAVASAVCEFGARAPDFSLPDPNGTIFTLADIAGRRGTLVMFICNHCPYVQAIFDRIRRDATELAQLGVGVVAISANDVAEYPQDSPAQMKLLAQSHGFDFPYLYDETQAVARAYGAQCTPDFFGYNADMALQYRGRLDCSGRAPADPGVRRDLFEAMKQIAMNGQGPRNQIASIGCSIKWKQV